MADFFTTQGAAADFVHGLQMRGIRALAWDTQTDEGLWRISSPDLDFRRDDRIWESAENALAARLAPAS